MIQPYFPKTVHGYFPKTLHSYFPIIRHYYFPVTMKKNCAIMTLKVETLDKEKRKTGASSTMTICLISYHKL